MPIQAKKLSSKNKTVAPNARSGNARTATRVGKRSKPTRQTIASAKADVAARRRIAATLDLEAFDAMTPHTAKETASHWARRD